MADAKEVAKIKLAPWIEIKEEIKATLETYKERLSVDVEISDFDLTAESLKTPKLHNKWLGILGDESYTLQKMESDKARFFLDRWKYWQGKQTDKYYAEYGIPHEKVLKSDLDKYLAADDYLIELDQMIGLQKQVVSFLEKSVKQISNRGFDIRAAIDWRKFENGV